MAFGGALHDAPPPTCYDRAMGEILSYLVIPVAIFAVAGVLVLGLVNMLRGGSPQRSQKLMRLRVLLQFVAVAIIMLTIWILGR